MSRIHIKRVFPDNNYTLRAVRLYVGNLKEFQLHQEGEEVFESREDEVEIKAKTQLVP